MHRVEIGRDVHDPRLPIVWDSRKVVNGHLLIIGESGSGKTFFLRKMISQIAQYDGLRVYIFDCHGDLDLPPKWTSSVKFSEGTIFGINPLILDPDLDAGGVRRSITRFISMVDQYSRVLGDKQRAALYGLLEEFYRANNYDPDDPSTWDRPEEETPSFLDFKNFSREKIKSIYVGNSATVKRSLDALSSKLRALGIKGAYDDVEREELADLRSKCLETFEELLDSLQSGREIDQIIDEPERDVLKSVHKRIENLYASGVFKNRKPNFNPSKPIWKLDVCNLTKQNRGFLVEVYLQRIFQRAKVAFFTAKNTQLGIPPPAHIIILDEAHLFLSPDRDHIILRLIREGRKFNIYVVLASQSHVHFPDEVATGVASTVILGLHEQYRERMGRLLGIKPSRFNAIQPHRRALVQMKTHDVTLNNGYMDVLVGAD